MFSILIAASRRPRGHSGNERLRVASAFVLKDIINGTLRKLHDDGCPTIHIHGNFRDAQTIALEVVNGCVVGSMTDWMPESVHEFPAIWEEIQRDENSGGFLTTGTTCPSLGELIAAACYIRNYEFDCERQMLTEAKSG